MRLICERLFLAAVFAGLAVPNWGAPVTLSDAQITTSLTQCATQTGGPCTMSPTASYSGDLSGFPGTQTVGAGAFVTASGFPSPTLTAQVPTTIANADISGDLTYLLEVVPTTGPSGSVSLGVDSTGSISVTTTGNSNDATLFSLVQLEFSSDASGTVIFNDEASIDYSASFDSTTSVCSTTNDSTASGVATVTASPACGGSSGSGGFDETGSYTIQTGALYLITMQAALNISTDCGSGLSSPPPGCGTVTGLATVDPIFTVPTGYALVLSPNVGNSAPSVPEPGTWTMLAAGVVVLIVASKRRRAPIA